MPRPFAVTGFTMFFAMLVLCCTGIGGCLPTGILFAALFIISMLIPSFREQRVFPVAAAAGVISCVIFAVFFNSLYDSLPKPGNYNIVAELESSGEKEYGRWYYEVEIESINNVECEYSARLSFRKKLDAEAFDKIQGVFTFHESDKSKSVYKVNSTPALSAYPAGYVNDNITVISVPEKEKPLRYRVFMLREKLGKNLKYVVPGENGEIASALLFGKTAEFSPELKSKFNSAGISHVICVSGLHLSVWALAVLELLKKIGLKRRISGIISSLFIVFYMALTGFTYSVVRAGIMMLIVLLGSVILRRGDSINSLGIASTVILCSNPFSACDAGFQLSFISTLGLILIMPDLAGRLKNKLSRLPKLVAKPAEYFLLIVFTTLCASVFTMPVSLVSFGEINLMAFVGNFCVIPAVSVCMITAGLSAFLPFVPVLSLLRYPFGLVCSITSKYIFAVVSKLSEIDFITFYPNKSLSYIWLGGALLIVGVALIYTAFGLNCKRITCAILASTFVSMLIISRAFYGDTAKITVIDSNNSASVLVTKGSYSALIGCGEKGFDTTRKISSTLYDNHIEKLNLIVLPSSQKYFTDNITDILSEFKTDVLACAKLPEWASLSAGDAAIDEFGEKFVMTLCDGCKITCISNSDECCVYIQANGVTTLMLLSSNGEFRQYSGADVIAAYNQTVRDINYEQYNAVILPHMDSEKTDYMPPNGIMIDGSVSIACASNGKMKIYRDN